MALYGGIAQLARAFGSYPNGHWFKSSCRYHFFDGSELFRSYSFGPLVKRLRHRPFTAVTGVRFSYGSPARSPARGVSFAGVFCLITRARDVGVLRMDLYKIGNIRDILERHGFHFSKALGQNFLTAAWVPQEITARSEIDESAGVLEIGPGMGCLTRELSRAAKRVVAVEVDAALLPVLDETLAGCENVTVVHQDILKADLPALVEEYFGGLRRLVCANLPYYITTPILTRLLESRLFDAITVMMQKEVALRLCAAPGTADYGAFTVFVQYYSEPEILFEVPRGCFVPQPKVSSAVVRLHVRKAPPVDVCDEALFFRVVRASFAQRRKQLLNGLSAAFFAEWSKERLAELLTQAGVDPRVRGETLSLARFADIANVLYSARKSAASC